MHHRDAAWFDGVFTAHAPAVSRYILRRASRMDAEDLTADVFVVAWRRRESIPDNAELPWLYRTAGFVVANHHRKQRPIPLHSVVDRAAEDEFPESAQWADAADDVAAVLSQLSPRDQRILLLSAWEGLTGAELATVLGISRGGADAALSRARSRLRDAWAAVDTPG